MSYTDTLKNDQKEAIRLMKISMVRNGITNDYMQAAIIAVVSKESGMKPKSEGGYSKTSNERIRKVFGRKVSDLSEEELTELKKDDVAFFNKVYGGRYGNAPDEGYKYRGRGLNQLTFKGNYRGMNKYTEEDIVANPDLVNTMPVAVDILIGYFLNNFKSKANKLDEYNMTDMNSATSAEDAVGAAYHANAGWGKDKAALERSNFDGRRRAFARVNDLVAYVNTVDVDVPIPIDEENSSTEENNTNEDNGSELSSNGIFNSVGEGGNNEEEDVKVIQRLLKARGYNMGKWGPNKDGVDGDCGKTTIKYIKEFQAKNKVEATGLILPTDAILLALNGEEMPTTEDAPVTEDSPTTEDTPTTEDSPTTEDTNNTSEGKTISKSVGEGGDNREADVMVIQQLLKDKGYDMGKWGPNKDGIDGDCGKTTIGHIKDFQTKNSIEANGLIQPGDATLNALGGNGGETPMPDDSPVVGKTISKPVGEGGNNQEADVMVIQQLLKEKGYDMGKWGPNKDGIDGDCGKTTIGHIKDFQTKNSINANGLIQPGDATLNALNGITVQPNSENKEMPNADFMEELAKLNTALADYFKKMKKVEKDTSQKEGDVQSLMDAIKNLLK